MQGVVYKQSYKPVGKSSTPVLNQKHLVYIATRPGAIPNKGCGFGLWGKLPDQREPAQLDDLERVKTLIGQVSRRRTVFRAVLSVDYDTALAFNLHDRAAWERLVNAQIGVIAKEMHIKESDFCYVASMHYKRRHPHVHLMFWDKSNTPRNPYIPKERFEEMSGRIRAAFNRELYGPEIRQAQQDQRAAGDELRLLLRSLLDEANMPDALNMDRIPKSALDELGRGLLSLTLDVRQKGSLKYKYLPPAYKARLDAWLDQVLALPAFATLQQRYSRLTGQISTLYGNDDKTKAAALAGAMDKLRTKLGNEVMSVIREAVQTLGSELPENVESFYALTRLHARRLLPEMPEYQTLLSMLPQRRTPLPLLLEDPAIRAQYQAVVHQLRSDVRLKEPARAFARLQRPAALQAALAEQEQTLKESRTPEARAAALENLRALRDEDMAGKQFEKDFDAAIRETVRQSMEEDKGYLQQAGEAMAFLALLRLFGAGSAMTGRSGAMHDLLRARRRELSKEARRDIVALQSQGSGQELEEF